MINVQIVKKYIEQLEYLIIIILILLLTDIIVL